VIKINASPQRRQKFHSVQLNRGKKLNLIQDISTRWNSTLRMIRRARKLRPALTLMAKRFPEEGLISLTSIQWKHLDYLIEILYPFSKYTNAIGKSCDSPTIHMVFQIYNTLYSHLDDNIDFLEVKRARWKVQLVDGLKKARAKLGKYYAQTKERSGDLYAAATILAPGYKLAFFEGKEWVDDEAYPYKWVCNDVRVVVTRTVTLTSSFSEITIEKLLNVLFGSTPPKSNRTHNRHDQTTIKMSQLRRYHQSYLSQVNVLKRSLLLQHVRKKENQPRH